MISFKSWLLKHRMESTPIGDLARDTYEIKDSIPDSISKEEFLEMLESNGAVDGAINAFETAWSEYQNSVQ